MHRVRDTTRLESDDPAGGHSRAADVEVVEEAVVRWRETESALAPIIGQRGFAALYQRSIHSCAQRFPWLVDGAEGIESAVNLEHLRIVLARQSNADAAAAGAALHQCFRELLISLVGTSLSDRLLPVPRATAASTQLPLSNAT